MLVVNFQEAQTYLLSLGNEVTAMKLGLEKIRLLLRELGDPQTQYRKVQVAGTNGKGSVCAFVNSICIAAKIKTGMYTSPHLVSITERVQIDGVPISEETFADLATRVRDASERLVSKAVIDTVPTFFEQVTAIALVAFADAKVELAILETGLGGRLDATTAANAEIAAITRIDLDHQQYLGETIEEIAGEKAAVIRADSKVCIGRQQPSAMSVILKRCHDLDVAPRTLEGATWPRFAMGYDFTLDGMSVKEIEIPLNGEHQAENVALAILVARELKRYFWIRKSHIRKGIGAARHPGRLEMIKLPSAWVFLDGAHNPGGAEALATYFTVKEDRPLSPVLLFGAMEDKNVSGMLKALAPVVNEIVATEAMNTRSMPTEKVAAVAKNFMDTGNVFAIPNYREAVEFAIERAESLPGYPTVLVAGSLYLVGEVKRILSEKLKTET